MNTTGDIRLNSSATMHLGDNYSIVNNYLDSNRHKTHREKVRVEFLRQLQTSPYEDRKNRNPKRADGTCKWFTTHGRFQNWREEKSAILWVSADPGCGKSVLARYLIDDILPSSKTRTTCYFFFKDDFDDQKTLEGALCCILHQLFIQRPALLSDEILDDFIEEEKQLFTFSRLWDMLIGAANRHYHGEIICIVDALDECKGPEHLAAALTRLYSKGKTASTLKFLVTSRPYRQIRQEFQDLLESQPTIHVSGECLPDEIAGEITISVKQRIDEICKKRQFSTEEKKILQEELAAVKHRTYLWVYLVFAVIEDALILNGVDLRTSIRNMPHTVEDAYDRILRRSQNTDMAREVLQIIVAADRPLHLAEMAAIMTLQIKSHECHENVECYKCHEDLERHLIPPDRLQARIREACRLFVVIQDSQIYLLHQTAREFLLQPKQSEDRSPLLK